MTSLISVNELNNIIETNKSLILINKQIDEFKACPGDPTFIYTNFFKIKNKWNDYQSLTTPDQAMHYQIVEFTLMQTQKRIEKLLKKYPSVSRSHEQQEESALVRLLLPKKALSSAVAGIVSGCAFYVLRPDTILPPSIVFSVTLVTAWAVIRTAKYVDKNFFPSQAKECKN